MMDRKSYSSGCQQKATKHLDQTLTFKVLGAVSGRLCLPAMRNFTISPSQILRPDSMIASIVKFDLCCRDVDVIDSSKGNNKLVLGEDDADMQRPCGITYTVSLAISYFRLGNHCAFSQADLVHRSDLETLSSHMSTSSPM
jgi:hypothetical protein